MNTTTILTPVLIVAIIAILVPAALFAAFSSTKDTHQYSQHYGKHGFTQETQQELVEIGTRREEAELEGETEAETVQQCDLRPITNWPTEL
ncbi:MAG: hypothetical protein ACE361_02940 [Aureliella sp.]